MVPLHFKNENLKKLAASAGERTGYAAHTYK
jgi:hypothetical protein